MRAKRNSLVLKSNVSMVVGIKKGAPISNGSVKRAQPIVRKIRGRKSFLTNYFPTRSPHCGSMRADPMLSSPSLPFPSLLPPHLRNDELVSNFAVDLPRWTRCVQITGGHGRDHAGGRSLLHLLPLRQRDMTIGPASTGSRRCSMTYTKPVQGQCVLEIMFGRLAWNSRSWALRPSCEWFDPRTRPS